MFALRHIPTGQLMGFSWRNNGEEVEGTDVSFTLVKGNDNVWCVKHRYEAEAAATNSQEWYNALYETPSNDFIGLLEVVELVIKI